MKQLTLSFCLHELGKNISEGFYSLRIGKSLLDFQDVVLQADSIHKNIYRVIDWDGNKYYYNDLLQAIQKFMEVNEKN